MSTNKSFHAISVLLLDDDLDPFLSAAYLALLKHRLDRIFPVFLRRAKKCGLKTVHIANDRIYFFPTIDRRNAIRLARILGGIWRDPDYLPMRIDGITLSGPDELYSSIQGTYNL